MSDVGRCWNSRPSSCPTTPTARPSWRPIPTPSPWRGERTWRPWPSGLEKGIVQGIPRGESRLLRRQLARRFGPLPGWVEARLTQVSTSELETWGERVLDAAKLDAVFRA